MNSELRKKCIKYMQKNYSDWPKSYSTWHTGACHHGYSWTQNQESEWDLVHHETGDIITEADYNTPIIENTSPSKVWIKFDSEGQIQETSTTEKVEKEWIEFNSTPSEGN